MRCVSCLLWGVAALMLLFLLSHLFVGRHQYVPPTDAIPLHRVPISDTEGDK